MLFQFGINEPAFFIQRYFFALCKSSESLAVCDQPAGQPVQPFIYEDLPAIEFAL
jgi:hypothetical protein